MDDLRTRLKSILEYKNLKYSAVAEKLDVTEQTIKNYLNGRTSVPIEKLSALSDLLGVSTGWLLEGWGQGPDYGFIDFEAEKEKKAANHHLIPYYDVDVMMTPIEVFNEQSSTPAYKIDMPGFADCDFAINVFGHSMYPTIESGMIVLCKKLSDKSLIIPGEIYFIVTQDYRMVKRLKKSSKKGYVIAASDNHNGHGSSDGHTYGSVELPLDKILHIYLVKGSFKRHLI